MVWLDTDCTGVALKNFLKYLHPQVNMAQDGSPTCGGTKVRFKNIEGPWVGVYISAGYEAAPVCNVTWYVGMWRL